MNSEKSSVASSSLVAVGLGASAIVSLPVGLIDASPLNPRRHSRAQLAPGALGELAASLVSQGQWDLITVRPSRVAAGRYELVNGERRWRAAVMQGIPMLEARVREMSDAEALDMMLATGDGENTVALSPVAKARGYEERMRLEGWQPAQLAERLGLSARSVYLTLSLLELPEAGLDAVDVGALSPGVAQVVASVPGEAAKEKFLEAVLHPEMQAVPLTRVQATELRNAEYARSLKGAPFGLDDAGLVPAAGACRGCAFMAGNNPEVYGEISKQAKATCMQPECFARKVAASRAVVVAEYAAKGVEVLSDEEMAEAYPRGEVGLNYRAQLVEYRKPVPADLLKAEVVAEGVSIAWGDICSSESVQVRVRLAFDQAHRPVEVVRVAEAVCAVDANEHAIFNEATRLRYGLERQGTVRVPKAMKPAPVVEAATVIENESETESESETEVESESVEGKCTWLDKALAGGAEAEDLTSPKEVEERLFAAANKLCDALEDADAARVRECCGELAALVDRVRAKFGEEAK